MIDKHKLREAKHRIRRVLLESWDPIGIRDEPNAQDEYDAYLGGVYLLLTRGASEGEIAEHLRAIERDRMGVRGVGPEQRARVAQALRGLDVLS